jgi:hypothetical protein
MYNVVNFAGLVGSATPTTLTATGTPLWTANQWMGYTVKSGVNSGKVISNTPTVLTVAAWVGSTPAAAATYTISPTNLAPALELGIVGRGTGSGTATIGAGPNDCNAANYPVAGKFSEQVPTGVAPLISPARVLAAMVTAGESVLTVSATDGTPMVASTGSDVLCMQVLFTDHNAPLSLTTEDNQFNGANPGAYSTNINFVFDGQ